MDEDMHVHSTYSDGRDSLEGNLARAIRCGLRRMVCVDHVRRDTTWLAGFCTHVERLARRAPIELYSGVEAKMLNCAGELDLPADFERSDFIYAADHQLPWHGETLSPLKVRFLLETGAVVPDQIFRGLELAYRNVALRFENVVMAHMFSILPKIGLKESELPVEMLQRLALCFSRRRVRVEIDERWTCPGLRVCQVMADAGVELWTSTDSHRSDTIGRYDFVRELAERLALVQARAQGPVGATT